MVTLLGKIFIRDAGQYQRPQVHRSYGILCSILGIVFNLVLFAVKFFAGMLTDSVAITADAFNNLSDAGSSLITLVGFRFAGMKADKEHPFGHGRIEYIAGLFVAMLIIIMGVELAKSSIQKIIYPESISVGRTAVVILFVSVLVKLYMAFYNYQIGKKIQSAAMKAAAADSLSDAVATTVVLLSMGIAVLTDVNVDGYGGLVVSAFILFAGYSAARETINPLLGRKPDPELIVRIYDIVMSHDMVVGVHDVIVHDYGPGRVMISLHAEVPGDEDIYLLHELIDKIEAELDTALHCESVIHMDPVEAHNEIVVAMRGKIAALVDEIDSCLSIHDFRMIPGKTYTNLIFDVVLPQEFYMTETEVQEEIRKKVLERYPGYYAIIKIEKAYV